MNDASFEKIMRRCLEARDIYSTFLKQCEDEYVRRFGVHPSDIDDDCWIDIFHYGGGCAPTVDEIRRGFELHK